ncbi:unnamed protein product [Clavelina lepadiformis]|uniref:Carboxylesterase type B domain-containing protein n=1 Tax=Clavelina lepadiformis TaxID=159417 RepID=A0ABP0FWG2_CLALP
MSFAIRKPFTKFRKRRSASIRGGENLPLRVRTTSGLVEGKNVKLSNYTIVNQYLGIPYAEPPIGKYRWAKAMPRVKNDVYWNATYHRAICPQSLQAPLPEYLLPIWYQKNSAFMKSFKMDENCLHLNIYVPVKRKNKDGSQAMGITGKLPVMIYFHGFTYSEGSGNFFDGSILAAHGNVIVVTFNYRLGILGFLSNGDENLPGNYGLWDQLQAVKWVTRNIGQFQGDEKRITAFGSGAGAASIGILMLSKQTEKNAKDGIKGERPVNITQDYDWSHSR